MFGLCTSCLVTLGYYKECSACTVKYVRASCYMFGDIYIMLRFDHLMPDHYSHENIDVHRFGVCSIVLVPASTDLSI